MTLANAFAGRRIVLPALAYVQILALVRNTLLARLLGPEQFGIAITFLLAQQFIDMSTDTGLNKFMLQDRAGNRPSVQATVQMMAASRGLIVGLLIVGIAWPLFAVIGLPATAAPFLLLAAGSLAMGLLHFDNARQQRNSIFVNDSLSTMIGETCGFVAALLALLVTQTYVAVLVGIMVRSVALAVTSHLMAQRRYRLRYSRRWMRRILGYSWPLLINGPLLFLSTQFDRLFVSALLGLRELGLYSAALLLVYLPLGLLTRVLGSTFVPRLSAAHHGGQIDAVEREFVGVCLFIAIGAGCGFTIVGPTALHLLYGAQYALPALTVSLMGLAQAVRFLRTWPSGVAISVAQTGNVLTSTIIRLLALPFGLLGIVWGWGIDGLAAGLLAGELLALLLSLVLLNRARRLPLGHRMAPVAVLTALALGLPTVLALVGATAEAAALYGTAALAASLVALHIIDKRLIPRNLSAFGW